MPRILAPRWGECNSPVAFGDIKPNATPAAAEPDIRARPIAYRVISYVGVGEVVMFVTAPDINPSEIMDLSRGLALRTTLSITYASVHSSHADRFYDLPKRTQARHKLYLPQEQIVDAVAAARASVLTNDVTAHIRVCSPVSRCEVLSQLSTTQMIH